MELLIRPKYNPEYDPEKNEYYDKCPIEMRCRVKCPYYCLCGAKEFSTVTEFKSHISTQKHKKFLLNYYGYIKDVNDAIIHAKQLQVKYELTYRELIELKQKYAVLEIQYKKLV
jgi:hypothetical protein